MGMSTSGVGFVGFNMTLYTAEKNSIFPIDPVDHQTGFQHQILLFSISQFPRFPDETPHLTTPDSGLLFPFPILYTDVNTTHHTFFSQPSHSGRRSSACPAVYVVLVLLIPSSSYSSQLWCNIQGTSQCFRSLEWRKKGWLRIYFQNDFFFQWF